MDGSGDGPDFLGRYALEPYPIGRGGMGDVYRGQDRRLDRAVAFKFVKFRDGYDAKLMERFLREARLTAALEHPGVPAVYDQGIDEGRPYLVMQFVKGITLADLVAEQSPLPVGWVAAIGAQICSVLAAAHRAGLVHRDLKPRNVMLEPDGWVKVLDFGLALDTADPQRLTSAGAPTPGTWAYMAPEQLARGDSSPASDLYALGCTLYELLTGGPPFEADTIYSLLAAHESEPAAPVRDHRAEVPEPIENLVGALLAKNPAERPADAAAVLRALLPYANGTMALPGVVDHSAAGQPRYGYAQAVASLIAPSGASPSGAVSDRVPPRPAPDVAAMDAARLALADRLFAEGDFGLAAAAYQQSADALDAVTDPDGDLRLDVLAKAGSCLALAGQPNLALARLSDLLQHERPRRGGNDERILRLRHQVALLQRGQGQFDAARLGLRDLLAHLERLHGTEHPLVRQVRADLNRCA